MLEQHITSKTPPPVAKHSAASLVGEASLNATSVNGATSLTGATSTPPSRLPLPHPLGQVRTRSSIHGWEATRPPR